MSGPFLLRNRRAQRAMNILFAWEQGEGYGHFSGIYPVARAMQALGHGTVLAVRQMEHVWQAGVPPFDRVFPAPSLKIGRYTRPSVTWADIVMPGGLATTATAIALTRGWLTLFETIQPDAIVTEHAPNALLAAHIAGIKAARLGTRFMCPPLSKPLLSPSIWKPHTVAERQAADSELLARINETCQAFARPGFDSLAAFLGTADDYIKSWPELDHYGDLTDTFYYGPMGGLNGVARPEWPGGEGPRTLMYCPATHRDFKPMIAALGRLGWPVLLHCRGGLVDDLPANISLSDQSLDLDYLLPQAKLVIHHAAHGTAAQALQRGVPHLCLPDTLERSMVAFQLKRHGLADMPIGQDTTRSCEAVAKALVSDSRIAENVAAAARRYGAYVAQNAAHEIAEDMLEGWG
jgi:hypothetical protein